MKEILDRLLDGGDLTRKEARHVMSKVMDGDVSDTRIAALLVALRAKGETADEIAGFAEAMRNAAYPVRVETDRPLVDTCGTGGASVRTFSVSTSAMFVVAAAGAAVAKHGNRSHSSACGSADLVEALGVPLDLDSSAVADLIEATGVGFMFAPRFHPAMEEVVPVREDLGIRTVFNILGPLTSPARVRRQVLGVYDPDLIPLMSEALANLGAERAFVVHGEPGMDEVSLAGETVYAFVEDGEISRGAVTPDDLGLDRAPVEEVDPLPPDEMARMLRRIFTGFRGPRHDMVVINAAFGIVAAGLEDDLVEAVDLARRVIESGKALDTLEAFVDQAGRDR